MCSCVCRKAISWALVLGLLSGSPCLGSDTRETIGKVLVSSGASVSGVALLEGSAVLADDVLSTGKGGRALVEFVAGVRAALPEESSARFRKTPGGLVAEVSLGTVVAQRRETSSLVVETPKYKVEPASPGRALYMVAMLPDKNTVVAARFGNVSITEISSGQSYLLAEGLFAEIPALSSGVPQRGVQERLEAAQAAHGKIKKPWHIGRLSHAASVALVAVLVVGAALAITIPLALREEKPVSPVVP